MLRRTRITSCNAVSPKLGQLYTHFIHIQASLMTADGISASSAVSFVREALAGGLAIRLFGSVAVWWRCPQGRDRFERLRDRPIRDIDLVGLLRDKATVERFFQEHGWVIDQDVARIPGAKYSLLYLVDRRRVWSRCDVHYNSLDFCHSIDMRKRLLVDELTIPLAELVLSKLQVRAMTSVDDFDVKTILLEHDAQPADGNHVNTFVFASRCGADWGLQTTVRDNLNRLRANVATDAQLTAAQRAEVIARLHELDASAKRGRRTLRWRLRGVIGRRMQWGEEVDPVGLAVGDSVH